MPQSPKNSASETRESLLDAAESLFAEHGIARASLRAITHEAGANLASVSYHFGSKEGLVRAVLGRRLGPINDRRVEQLERISETQSAALEAVVRAFVAPALTMIREEPRGEVFARLVGRSLNDPHPEVRELVRGVFRDTATRFVSALVKLLPELPPNEVVWRFYFMVGAFAHTVAGASEIRKESGGLCDTDSPGEMTERLVVFLTAGLRAPAPPGDSPT